MGSQSEKLEEKPAEKESTVEVSSPACHLINTPKFVCHESQSLRQRRRLQKPPDNAQNFTPSIKDCASVIRDPDDKSPSSKFKYPRVNSKYPIIPPINSQIQSNEPTNSKTITCASPRQQSAMFLKCPLNRQSFTEKEAPERNRKTTDLDIQFQQMKLENLSTITEENPRKKFDNSGSQSLIQYCNFDEKKVVKVAPHIRRKDVICDTVDVWSRQSDTSLRYRPLIFGGTFPIDAPFTTNAISESDKKLFSKQTPKTFIIDSPTSL